MSCNVKLCNEIKCKTMTYNEKIINSIYCKEKINTIIPNRILHELLIFRIKCFPKRGRWSLGGWELSLKIPIISMELFPLWCKLKDRDVCYLRYEQSYFLFFITIRFNIIIFINFEGSGLWGCYTPFVYFNPFTLFSFGQARMAHHILIWNVSMVNVISKP